METLTNEEMLAIEGGGWEGIGSAIGYVIGVIVGCLV